jgi:aflatoxin B1 aldehyde reductase
MDEMAVFKDIYVSDTRLQLLENLKEVCDRHGVAVKEATLRWFMHHSALGEEDGVILGASSAEQAEENCKACEGGPLPDEVVERFAEMWSAVREGAWPYPS